MNFQSIRSKINLNNKVLAGIAAGALAFLVVTGVYYYFVYAVLKAEAAQKAAVFNGVKLKYESYRALVRSYPSLLKEETRLDGEFIKLMPEMPPKEDIPQLLMKVSNIEKFLGLNLKMFKPEKTSMKGFYETVPFSMNITGDFYSVYKFFYKLAVMKRIVDADNVIISKTSAGSKVTVSFIGTAYSFTGPPPAPAIKNTVKANVVQAVKKAAGGAVKK